MIGDIRKLAERVPFEPFAIRTTDGREYPVPTLDHLYFTPGGHRVVIGDDDGTVQILSGLHIGALVHLDTDGATPR